MRAFAMAVVAVLAADVAFADEKPIQLKNAPGLDKVEANCGGCHSLDYIVMNSPFLDATGWAAEVAKMIKAFGAPIEQADAEVIAAYLKENYAADRLVARPQPAALRPPVALRPPGSQPTALQPPRSQPSATTKRPDREAARQKVLVPREPASAGRRPEATRFSTNVVRPQARPGLFHWMGEQPAATARPTERAATGGY